MHHEGFNFQNQTCKFRLFLNQTWKLLKFVTQIFQTLQIPSLLLLKNSIYYISFGLNVL